MTIYTYWDDSPDAPPHQAELVALWRRSWSAQGWKCRLLTRKDARLKKRGPEIRTILAAKKALQSVGGKFFCPVWVMNFSLSPDAKKLPRARAVGLAGWDSAELVDFGERAAPSDIQYCGRALAS